MIDETSANHIAQAFFDAKSVGRDYHLVVWQGKTIEKEYGWIILSITQEYLDSIAPTLMVVGPVHVVVERDSGSLFQLRTSFGLELAIADYEAWRFFNFQSLFYDLTIQSVQDLEKTIDLLTSITLFYAKQWRLPTGAEIVIPYACGNEELRELLSQLPFTFRHQDVRRFFKVFQELDATECCKYKLAPSEI